MKNVIIGTLAHVDAGKTTLSESMLYAAGSIRKLGRVDHKDTFLDFDAQERNRGITIFSKQAMFNWLDTSITLIDTPGHVDFSAEMERTLQILDYAIIVVSALDGIQGHTETIWNLLKYYEIPTFIFVNKMDITHFEKAFLMQEIQNKCSSACVDFTIQDETWLENISLCDDALLEEYMERNTISSTSIQACIAKRELFPCFFGSALKNDGVESFLNSIANYTKRKVYPTNFGATVYKITMDEQGNKLTHMKITGGKLSAKEKIKEDEKVDQIRLYSGLKYEMVSEVMAGQVCAIKGLKNISIGEGLGIQNHALQAQLSPYLSYRVILPSECDINKMVQNLSLLAQEDPQLDVHYRESIQEITIHLMGEIQIEVLKNVIKERFGVDVTFDQGNIIYKESIVEPIEGVGHFEPLRHYAEVHLLLEPLDRNRGLLFESACKEDDLPRQWQRLILSHLQEKEHLGVLTGSEITDMKITLLSGKAHEKHTEGGDFRQATYRAVRQGLKSTKSILLEPYYQFQMEIPSTSLSRAMHDLQMRNATYAIEEETIQTVVIGGSVAVAKMQNYALELQAYTKGKGKLFCSLKGYEECKDSSTIIEAIGYDSEKDIDHPTGSIFCAHGAGYFVPWNEVKNHMHLKASWKPREKTQPISVRKHKLHVDDEELAHVMKITYGEEKVLRRNTKVDLNQQEVIVKSILPQCFIIDGYNVIYAWDELRTYVPNNFDAARSQLEHIVSSFQGFKKCKVILVYDAYQVKNEIPREFDNGNIHIIFSKENQTADSYIEKITSEMGNEYQITVVSSDIAEQVAISAQGARRMSALEFKRDVEAIQKQSTEEYERKQSKAGNRLLSDLRKLNEE